jgi:hypothetical protein
VTLGTRKATSAQMMRPNRYIVNPPEMTSIAVRPAALDDNQGRPRQAATRAHSLPGRLHRANSSSSLRLAEQAVTRGGELHCCSLPDQAGPASPRATAQTTRKPRT